MAMAQYFVGNFTFFSCISWMFPYLVQRYSLTPAKRQNIRWFHYCPGQRPIGFRDFL